MGWWSGLFGRRGAPAPPYQALPPPAPPPPAPLVEEPGDISPARLDAALQRLREQHPETAEE